MRPRHLFGVLIRIGGIWAFSYAVISALEAVAKMLNIPIGSNYTWQFNVVVAFGYLLIGFVLLFGADIIVALVYQAPDEVDEARRF